MVDSHCFTEQIKWMRAGGFVFGFVFFIYRKAIRERTIVSSNDLKQPVMVFASRLSIILATTNRVGRLIFKHTHDERYCAQISPANRDSALRYYRPTTTREHATPLITHPHADNSTPPALNDTRYWIKFGMGLWIFLWGWVFVFHRPPLRQIRYRGS